MILVDEIESHLHPQWQRVVLEALLDVIKELGTEGAIQRGGLYPNIQAIVTTHAPLVMASAESIFCEELDKLHVFDVENRQVTLSEMPWAKQGDASDWLVSKAFGLKAGAFEGGGDGYRECECLYARRILDGEGRSSSGFAGFSARRRSVLAAVDCKERG